MKKTLLVILLFALASVIQAQTLDKKWGIGAGVGPYGGLNKSSIGFIPELYLSTYLSPRFDLMLKGDMGLFNTKLKNNLDIADALLNLRLKLLDESKKFRPYLFAGPGILADNSISGVNLNIGLGGKYYVSPATALYLETGFNSGIKSTNYAGKDVHDNFWKATLGVEFDLGKTKDSDMDGVSDKKDKCPNTPTGVAVDANGCPLDSDGDSVADNIDDCPQIPGLTSLKGCPDKDNDGIANKDDACPDVAGLISLKGCPDTDVDGIADKDDKCPDTPKDVKVDATGCPIDTDGDGIADYLDKCPTMRGLKENNGCPAKEPEKSKEITADQVIIQKDVKATPVHFVSDKSYLTNYSKGILDKLIQILNLDKAYMVNMFGYADSQGSDNYNIKLSQARIESVTAYLTSKGIDAKRIIHQKAFGEANPVASNDTEEGRLKNRRVEFEIFKMK